LTATAPPSLLPSQALTAEFVGTFLLVMTISLSAQAGNPPSYPQQYLAIGLTLGAMIYALDHISGAHFNPAVTLGALLNQRIDALSATLYVVVQVAGGVCGALTALGIASPGNIKPFTPTGSSPWGTTGSAFAVEFLYTLALVLVMQNAALEKNAREPNSYFGLAVSFTVLAGARAVGPISGGCE
jgi:aquaporin Z